MRIWRISLLLAVWIILSSPSGFRAENIHRDQAALVFPVSSAQGVHTISVKESCFAEDTLFWYIERPDGPIESMSGQIGLETAETITWESEMDDGVEFAQKTMILVDNSISVSSVNREKTSQVLKQLILSKSPVETYAVASFSRGMTMWTDYTASQELLIRTVDSITYQDQDAFLNDILAENIHKMNQESSGDTYQRILLVSDGANDNPLGCSDASLYELLEESSCVVDVVNSGRSDNLEGANRLKEIASRTNGSCLLLDEWEDTGQAPEMLSGRDPMYRICIPVPYDCMDGLSRTVRVHFTIQGETYEITREESFPLIDAQFLKEWKKSGETESGMSEKEQNAASQKEKDQSAADKSEEDQSADDQSEFGQDAADPAESDQEVPDQSELDLVEFDSVEADPSIPEERLSQSDPDSLAAGPDGGTNGEHTADPSADGPQGLTRLLLILGAVVVGAASGAGLYLFRKRIRARELPGPEPEEEAEIYHSDFEEGELSSQAEREWPDSSQTRMMWSDADRNLMVLRDVSEHTRFFRITLEQDVVVGRDARKCQVVIPGDPSISSGHVRFTRKKDQIYLEDLGSSNGTYLNGNRLEGRVPVRDGDLIKIGRTELMIEL